MRDKAASENVDFITCQPSDIAGDCKGVNSIRFVWQVDGECWARLLLKTSTTCLVNSLILLVSVWVLILFDLFGK
jgi:hypothetical protein